MSDELRSALACPAPGSRSTRRTKEVQGENKRLKEQLKEEDTLPANAEKTPWPPAGWHQKRSPKVVGVHLPVAVECLVKALARRAPPWRTCLKTLARRRSVSPICCSHDATWRKKAQRAGGQPLSADRAGTSRRHGEQEKGEGGQPQLGHAHGRDQNI